MLNCVKKRRPRTQRGATIVSAALALGALMFSGAIVADLGNVYVHKTVLQNATDAAALAGGHEYIQYDDETEAEDSARDVVKEWIRSEEKNKSLTNVAEDGIDTNFKPMSSGGTKIIVTATDEVPLYFARFFGLTTWSVTTKSIALCTSNDDDYAGGIFDYAMIGASKENSSTQQLNSFWFDRCSTTIHGKVHANGGTYMDGGFETGLNDSGHLAVTLDKSSDFTFYDPDDPNDSTPTQSKLWATHGTRNRQMHEVNDTDGSVLANSHIWDWVNDYNNLSAKTLLDWTDGNEAIDTNLLADDVYAPELSTNPNNPYIHYYRMKDDATGRAIDPTKDQYIEPPSNVSKSGTLTSRIYDYIEALRELDPKERDESDYSAYVVTSGNYDDSYTAESAGQFNADNTGSYDQLRVPYQETGEWVKDNNWNVDAMHHAKTIILDKGFEVQVTYDPQDRSDDTRDVFILISLHGDIVVRNKGDFQGLVYAPNGTVKFDSSGDYDGDFYGSIIAQHIIFNGQNAKEVTNRKFSILLGGNDTAGGSGSTGGSSRARGATSVTLASNEDDE